MDATGFIALTQPDHDEPIVVALRQIATVKPGRLISKGGQTSEVRLADGHQFQVAEPYAELLRRMTAAAGPGADTSHAGQDDGSQHLLEVASR